MKKVYIGLSGDFIHHGIINIISKGKEYGDVIVGCLTDNAISEHRRIPHLDYESRRKVLENIKGVSQVVVQDEWDYSINLKKIRPDYMIHGDDWLEGAQKKIRNNCIKILNSYGGKLIEIPFTQNVTRTSLIQDFDKNRSTPDFRKSILRRLIKSKKIVRIIEAHSPISALI